MTAHPTIPIVPPAAAATKTARRKAAGPTAAWSRTANAKTVWVLVADEAVARFLRRPREGGELESLETLTDPAAHIREGDFDRDAAARRGASLGVGKDAPHRPSAPTAITSPAGAAPSLARRAKQLASRRPDRGRGAARPRRRRRRAPRAGVRAPRRPATVRRGLAAPSTLRRAAHRRGARVFLGYLRTELPTASVSASPSARS